MLKGRASSSSLLFRDNLDSNTINMKIQVVVQIFCSISVLLCVQYSVEGRLLSEKKPDPKNAAATARWLVSQNSWGVLKYLLSPYHYFNYDQGHYICCSCVGILVVDYMFAF